MKINCNIIKDLLPSYIDDISSKETTQLVEEHLIECENCKKILDEMKKEIRISSVDEKMAIKTFFKKIYKKRIVAIILSITITLFLVIFVGFVFNKKDFIMQYEEDLISVEEIEKGKFIANVNTINYNTCQLILEENYDGTIDVYVTLFQSFMDKLFAKEDAKSFGCVPKCYKNYIDENVDVNWLWENARGKIVLDTHNNVEIANIYYLDTEEKFTTILTSRETDGVAFEMPTIWSNQ